MKKILIITISLLTFLPVRAEDSIEQAVVKQTIDNEKTYASINLNSQIIDTDGAERQNIANRSSWFNININRYTYKFYLNDKAVRE